MAFEVDETGITTPKLPEARARVVELWKARYGQDAATSSDSPDGLLIDIMSLLLALVWEGNGDVYANAYFRTSGGVSLELLLDLFDRRRLKAAASTASLVLYGTGASPVNAGTVASVESTGDRFATDTAVTIGAADTTDVYLIKTADNGKTYNVQINATNFNYTATPSDDTASVVDELRQLINAGAEPVESFDGGLDGDGYGRLVIDSDSSGQTFASSNATADVEIYAGARVGATAEETGPITALAGELDVIETPVTGLLGVTTTADAAIGRDRETDGEFKVRHIDTLRSFGSGTPLAIRDRILENVSDTVLTARVFENEGSTTDARGVPPHAVNPVVLSSPIGGPYTDDEEIAQQILNAKGGGYQSFGATVVNLANPQAFGPLIPIGFDRPTVGYLHLEITVTPGEGFPTTGNPATAIRDAVVAWLSTGGGGYLDLGTDLVRYQLGEPINEAVDGIGSVVIRTASTSTPGGVPTFAAADILVPDDEILLADSSRTTVTIV